MGEKKALFSRKIQPQQAVLASMEPKQEEDCAMSWLKTLCDVLISAATIIGKAATGK